MLLHITHQTQYHYQSAVQMAQHIACMHPLEHAGQQVLEHSLQVQPQPAMVREHADSFGNTRSYFALHTPHTELDVMASSLVQTHALELPLAPPKSLPWETLRDAMRYQTHQAAHPAAAFVYASPYVPRQTEFVQYALPSFASGTPLLEVAVGLMQRIHHEFTYQSQSTQVNTPAVEALAQRKGVCQDFAHILLACWRSMGLPARYVSGYLLTHPAPGQEKLVGSDASHAWASVYVPDLEHLPPAQRWVDLDPTNDRWGWASPGEDYVTVAVGRDFGDVSPLRGVIHGGGSHTLHVGVTVMPLEQEALA
ncbi:transglutaminase family protein [Curvibacter sp. CHRR-16]|uniref:transglutaminase family protein n=1 Tax=Curvibacter sp. CHRR-16 TaxID=2835872 RepID=UPI001BDA8218|nr:transglutaminase family protein [Curvibacter sp. CHRR-16]MBT0569078.1 transglutaminase family protein [Curvibacter sp. CHRR-16]